MWRDVSTDRVSSGRLWLPALSLDLMSRDWSLHSHSFDFHLEESSAVGTGAGAAWATVATLRSHFPASWDYDATFDSQMKLRLTITIEAKLVGGGPAEMRLDGSTDISDVFSTAYSYRTLTRTWIATDGDSLPSGWYEMPIEANITNTETFYVRRTWGIPLALVSTDDGAVCRLEFLTE